MSSRTDTVNSNGQLQSVAVINDNSSQDQLYLNANDNQPWREQNWHYDAQNRLDYVLTINNDSSMDWQDEDQDNSQTWTTINSHQTATGALDWRRYINDDGTEEWLDLDQDNTQQWSQQASYKNTFAKTNAVRLFGITATQMSCFWMAALPT
ncbi:MAG: hypothetical protein IPL02_01350 [Moraxellaceae bacterium]|nr:hypothetical protein [Moraxellaceae bacterium]